MRAETEALIKEVQAAFPDKKINLNNVNDFYLVLEDSLNCKDCKGLYSCKNSNQGFYLKNSGNDFYQVRCKLMQEFQSSNHTTLLKSEYSEAESDVSLKDYDKSTENRVKLLGLIHEFVSEYKSRKEGTKGLYIFGTYAVGKTYSMMICAKELSKAGIDHIFVYFPDLVNELKAGLESEKFDKIVDLMKNTDVLMLDDFGAEAMSPWLRDNVVGPIFNYRMMYNKPVFISSNLAPQDLKKHLALNNSSEEQIKAQRILERMKPLIKSVELKDADRVTRR